ncbi:MAG: BrnT family toxin [Rhizobium sp.]
MAIYFDPAKRDKALAERGLDFARCAEIFAGETLTREDDRKDYGAQRYITVGWLDGRMLVVVWTPRDGGERIISMRKANDREQKVYGRRMARH